MADIICANTTFAEVQSKLRSAVSGDRVLIPAGTVTFNQGIASGEFSEDDTLKNKAITIQGGYGGGTTIFDDARAQSPIYPSRREMIWWKTINSGTHMTCIRNITFLGSNATTFTNGNPTGTFGTITLLGDSNRVRLTQCAFFPRRQPIFVAEGYVRGVMDNCTCSESLHSNGTVAMYIHHGSWENVGGYGDKSWSLPHTMGTQDAFFIEDCDFVNNVEFGGFRAAMDGWKGHRVVFRYNRLHNMTWANHGTESGGRPRSARQSEIYENVITSSVGFTPTTIGTRGGISVIFNNTMTTPNPATDGPGVDPRWVVSMTNQRNDLGKPGEIFFIWGWAGKVNCVSITRAFNGTNWVATVTSPNRNMGGAVYHGFPDTRDYIEIRNASPAVYNGIFQISAWTNTTFSYILPSDPGSDATIPGQFMSPWDGNLDDLGYRCVDQVGTGPSVLISGDVPVGQPLNQGSDPTYIWNNTRNGVVQLPIQDGSYSTQIILPGRDYFTSPRPGYTPFPFPHPYNDISSGGGGDVTPPATPTGFVVS